MNHLKATPGPAYARRTLPIALLAVWAATPSQAALPQGCPAPAAGQWPAGASAPATDDKRVHLQADRVEGTSERFELSGNVAIIYERNFLSADRVLYDRSADQARLLGDVRYVRPGLELTASRGSAKIKQDRGRFEEVHYEITDYNARGDAAAVQQLDAASSRLEDATYTTCRPQQPDWQLRAGEVTLDRSEGVGEARNVSLRFKNIPLFYTPWMSFPIQEKRKSGFLYPSIGNSQNSGAEFSIPYYWNIAPNRDATLAPRLLSRRGVQLNGEYRYLTRRSQGRLNFEYLPDDNLFGGDRGLFSYRQHSRFGRHWSAEADISHVSDDDYFEDLSQSLDLSSLTHLERRVELRDDRRFGWTQLQLQNFQTVGAAAEPYERLPALTSRFRIPSSTWPLTYRLLGQYARFEHPDAGTVPTGSRLDLKPGIQLEWGGPAWYLRPAVSARHTAYYLDDAGAAGAPESPSRTLPIASLDSGMFFERQLRWGERRYVQTLEPRLFYLYVPYEDQSELPVFDSTRLDFSFAQLFRDNRFTGADRQGDANQLTVALTTRVLAPDSGREQVRASIGQIVHFRDRRVTLPGTGPETTDTSPLVAELAVALGQTSRVRADIQWDPDSERTDKSALWYHYQPDAERILNVGYRFRRSDLEQTDVSAMWPLSRHWNAVARWNYSLAERRTLEGFAGLEYETCCWSLRLVGRHYITGTRGETNNAVYLQLALKGLTSIGKSPEGLLERGILGYGRDTDLEF